MGLDITDKTIKTMENEITIFEHPDLESIRVLFENDGNPLFVATDVAKSLGYTNPRAAIITHCESGNVVNRYVAHTSSVGGVSLKLIPESEVYSLIFGSKLPNALKFKRWVVEEVLPSIRKHGAYMTPQKIEEALLNPDTIIQLAQTLKAEREMRVSAENTIALQAPKVFFAEAVEANEGSCTIAELSILAQQKGINIGQNRLYKWLRENGYLCKSGEKKNVPTQISVESGYFDVGVAKEEINSKTPNTKSITRVTPKGQMYLLEKLINAFHSQPNKRVYVKS